VSRFIPLIGGPKNGETIQLPDEVNFRAVDMGDINGEVIYTVCQSGDGYFYGVFNPSSNDPSVARIEALRNAILGAMG
jgi:hypothetical protein